MNRGHSNKAAASCLLQERVQLGVMPELVELAKIQGVKGYRARQLFNAGLRTIKDVAESDPSTLEAIFSRGMSLHLGQSCVTAVVRKGPLMTFANSCSISSLSHPTIRIEVLHPCMVIKTFAVAKRSVKGLNHNVADSIVTACC